MTFRRKLSTPLLGSKGLREPYRPETRFGWGTRTHSKSLAGAVISTAWRCRLWRDWHISMAQASRPLRRAIVAETVLKTRHNFRSSTTSMERSMSLDSELRLDIHTVMKTVRGLELGGLVYKNLRDFLCVWVPVPTDGSTPRILSHAPQTGDLSGHDVLAFCSHAVNHAHYFLSQCKSLEKKRSHVRR
jgi:hypothetical protein